MDYAIETADGVPKQAKQQTREQNDPETDEPVRQVGSPTPLASVKRAAHRSANEKPAKDKEDDHALVSCIGEAVDSGEPQSMRAEFVEGDEEEMAPVIK